MDGNAGNVGNDPSYPSYPGRGNITKLLNWHLLENGTRPDSQDDGEVVKWGKEEFWIALGRENREDYSLLRQWLRGDANPGQGLRQKIAFALLGTRTDGRYQAWREDILAAGFERKPKKAQPKRDIYEVGSDTAGTRKSTPVASIPIPRNELDSIEDVGFVAVREMEIARREGKSRRAVKMTLVLEQQLSVRLGDGREISFGIGHVWLAINAQGPGRLRINQALSNADGAVVKYRTYTENEDGRSICITAEANSMLPEIPLKSDAVSSPAIDPNDNGARRTNYPQSTVAFLDSGAKASEVTAWVDVWLRPQDIHLPNTAAEDLTQTTKDCIGAIMAILNAKERSLSGNKLRLSVPVFEQE